MNLQLKVEIELAIQKVIDDNCELDRWPHLITDKIVRQMTDATELVFDASMDSQEYYAHENQEDTVTY